jgi:hypothetical protein
MADDGDVLTDLNLDDTQGGNGADNQPVAGVISQYVKDLSVENPNAPACFQWQSQPNIDLQFNIAAPRPMRATSISSSSLIAVSWACATCPTSTRTRFFTRKRRASCSRSRAA